MAEVLKSGNRRWGIGVLLAVGVLVNYLDRISISVAAPQLQKELNLSAGQIGLLLSAFFWSYSLAQLPSGMLLDRFGVMRVGRIGAFLWTLASTLTALSTGCLDILRARSLRGVAGAPGMISGQKPPGYCFPRHERSRSTA